MFLNWFPYKTHAHITGGTQYGKSKLAELMMRMIIKCGACLFLFDWHGTLFHDIVAYLAYLGIRRPVYLIDPSSSRYILGYNPFALPAGENLSAHVERLTRVILSVWGATDANMLPTFERVVKMVLSYAAVTGEPIHHALYLLDHWETELREHAIEITDDRRLKRQWQYLQSIRGSEQWGRQVESTQNRLGRFVGSDAFKLFTGSGAQFSVKQAIEENAIVLVNVRPDGASLSTDSARLFTSLLFADVMHAALKNIGRPKKCFVIADECQNYINDFSAEMLDQTAKAGLRLTLIHHHLGQFDEQTHLLQSIESNAGIKIRFKGMPIAAVKPEAESMWLNELNKRWKKDDRFRVRTDYFEEDFVGGSETHGNTPGGPTSSETTTHASHLVPYQYLEPDGQEDWSREEKLSKLAARFHALQRAQCYVQLPDKTYLYNVPFVTPYLSSHDNYVKYLKHLLRNHIPLHEAATRLKNAETTFLERSREDERPRAKRTGKKASAHLFPQA